MDKSFGAWGIWAGRFSMGQCLRPALLGWACWGMCGCVCADSAESRVFRMGWGFFFWCFCCRSRIADVSIYRRRLFLFPWWRRNPLWQGVNERLWDVGKKSGKTLFCLRYFLLAFPSSPFIFKHFFVPCRFAHWCFCIPRRSFHVKICRHCLAHIGFLGKSSL